MILGYARVSTKDQSLDLQIDALKNAGCDEIYLDQLSGRNAEFPEFENLLSKLKGGDLVMVYKLDRLGRTFKELSNLLLDFKERSIYFKSIQEELFDTTSNAGELAFQIIVDLRAMELNVLGERTKDGLQKARARGKNGGRPKGSYNKSKAAAAVSFYRLKLPIREIASKLEVSSSTLYEYLKKEGVM